LPIPLLTLPTQLERNSASYSAAPRTGLDLQAPEFLARSSHIIRQIFTALHHLNRNRSFEEDEDVLYPPASIVYALLDEPRNFLGTGEEAVG
jgi:hypothetical protein